MNQEKAIKKEYKIPLRVSPESDSTRTKFQARIIKQTYTSANNRRRGTRGKFLRLNSVNQSARFRSCPKRSLDQEIKIRYHKKISSILKNIESAEVQSYDLTCKVCKTETSSTAQLRQHFQGQKHKLNLFKCTPKYCAPCGIFYGFETPQIWVAHLRSAKHAANIPHGKLPVFTDFQTKS